MDNNEVLSEPVTELLSKEEIITIIKEAAKIAKKSIEITSRIGEWKTDYERSTSVREFISYKFTDNQNEVKWIEPPPASRRAQHNPFATLFSLQTKTSEFVKSFLQVRTPTCKKRASAHFDLTDV